MLLINKNMFLFSNSYNSVFLFIFIAVILSILIFFFSYFIVEKNYYSEKLSPYECGFDPFDDARNQFDIGFYLVSILFLIFDLEASFLFPWVVSLSNVNFYGFWSIVDFLVELLVGFFYVWKIGALEWASSPIEVK